MNIDLNDMGALKKAEQELLRQLAIVRFALGKNVPPPPDRSKILAEAARNVEGGFIGWRADVFNHLPLRFTSSDVFRYASENHPEVTRDTIKGWLRHCLEIDRIRVVLYGKARKPTAYEKITTPLTS